MLAKVDRLGARPASRPPGGWPTRCAGPGSTASSPTATCWSRCCADRRSWPATSAPPSSTRTGLHAARPARGRGAGRRRGRRDRARRARRGRPRTVQRGHPGRPGATSSQPAAAHRVRRRPATSSRSRGTAGATATRVDGVDGASRPRPSRVVLEVDGVPDATYDVGRSPATREVDVDGPTGHVALRAVARFTDPADAVASGILLAPMPGTVVRGRGRGRRRGRGRAAGAGARGDEDAAHRRARRTPAWSPSSTSRAGAQVAAGEVPGRRRRQPTTTKETR